MHLLLKIFSDCVVNISVILTTSCSITICSGILHQRGLLCVESSCVNTRVSAKETDKSTTSLNNSKLSAIYSSCKLLKPLTALLICVLWLCPVQCVQNDQNQMEKKIISIKKMTRAKKKKNPIQSAGGSLSKGRILNNVE